MAAERELSDLDEQFSGVLPQGEIEDSMQIHGADDEALDMDSDDDALDDTDDALDDEALGDDGFDANEDFDE